MKSCEKIFNKLLENIMDLDLKIVELALQNAMKEEKIKLTNK